jgi:hypothetical protein
MDVTQNKRTPARPKFRIGISSNFNSQHFHGKLDKNGTETIIHAIRSRSLDDPFLDMYIIDAKNAFNAANRTLGLLVTTKHMQKLIPLLRAMYRLDSQG